MDMYIHLENLALFRKRLADTKTTATEREVILKLLAEEEARKLPTRPQGKSG
jgi:hypothetical protein